MTQQDPIFMGAPGLGLIWKALKMNGFKITMGTIFLVSFYLKDCQIEFGIRTGKAETSSVRALDSESNVLGDLSGSDRKAVSVSRASLQRASLLPSARKKGQDDHMAEVSNFKATSVQEDYVKRFAQVAQSEMMKFGIPASITLAQGLLESGAGQSALSKKHNNHFGIKCFSKKCGAGHCQNFSDDHHKDFFRKYRTAWESFRDHSHFLSKKERYQHLLDIPITDYKNWAIGLQEAGYATSKTYAADLIALIEGLKLDQFDQHP